VNLNYLKIKIKIKRMKNLKKIKDFIESEEPQRNMHGYAFFTREYFVIFNF